MDEIRDFLEEVGFLSFYLLYYSSFATLIELNEFVARQKILGGPFKKVVRLFFERHLEKPLSQDVFLPHHC